VRPFLLAYAGVALAVIIAQLADLPWLYSVSKPLIMITLGAGYWFSVGAQQRSNTVLFAILFSWIGDILLMFNGDVFFMGGLGSFLLGHVFYILAYRQHRNAEGEGLNGVQKFRFSFPVILATTGLITILLPYLGGLTVPVLIYAFAITATMLLAIYRYGYTNATSYWLVFAGALLFMISDSTLAINKFMGGFPYAGLAVMATYMGAQVLIITGLKKHGSQ
jgi:uncharacterized membrane protein YhhN